MDDKPARSLTAWFVFWLCWFIAIFVPSCGQPRVELDFDYKGNPRACLTIPILEQ